MFKHIVGAVAAGGLAACVWATPAKADGREDAQSAQGPAPLRVWPGDHCQPGATACHSQWVVSGDVFSSGVMPDHVESVPPIIHPAGPAPAVSPLRPARVLSTETMGTRFEGDFNGGVGSNIATGGYCCASNVIVVVDRRRGPGRPRGGARFGH